MLDYYDNCLLLYADSSFICVVDWIYRIFSRAKTLLLNTVPANSIKDGIPPASDFMHKQECIVFLNRIVCSWVFNMKAQKCETNKICIINPRIYKRLRHWIEKS